MITASRGLWRPSFPSLSQLEGLLFEEQQRTSEMEGRVEELREQLEQADSRQRARMDEIERYCHVTGLGGAGRGYRCVRS